MKIEDGRPGKQPFFDLKFPLSNFQFASSRGADYGQQGERRGADAIQGRAARMQHTFMTRSTFQPLTLGTVQLGLPYGIANTSGQPDMAQAREILEAAKRGGVAYLDTAPGYGTSEATLGELLPQVDPAGTFRVVSKVAAGQAVEAWGPQLEASLTRLNCRSLHTWLLHDENDFARIDANVVSMIEAARPAGKLGAFGVSCYTPEIALEALQHPVVSALQVPANVFDRRFLSDEVLDALKARSGFVFVRSVFLQGLGLMAPEQAPRHVPQAFEAVATLSSFCTEIAMTRQAFCLHYVSHRLRGTAHSLIVGVETAAQLQELLTVMETPAPGAEVFIEWDKRWPCSPVELVNPGLWKRS